MHTAVLEPASPGAWVVGLIQRTIGRHGSDADDHRGQLADLVHAQSGDYLATMGAEVEAALTTAVAVVNTPLGIYRPRMARRKVIGFSIYRHGSRDAWHLWLLSEYDTSLQLKTEIAGRVEVRHLPFAVDGCALALRVAGELVAPVAAAQRVAGPFLRFIATRA